MIFGLACEEEKQLSDSLVADRTRFPEKTVTSGGTQNAVTIHIDCENHG